MVLFNYSTKEITAKLVYYGPGLGGKTTNLQFIHSKLDPKSRGKLLSLATESDRTLFFDFLPLELGGIGGFHVRFQLYTVPGQVHYNATRRMVLKGVDAVVFVVDSQLEMMESNRESYINLAENLAENGYRIEHIPIVLQANKRDLPNVASPEEIVAALDAQGHQIFKAVANRGEGVFETLRAIIKLSVHRLKDQFKEDGIKEPVMEDIAEPPKPVASYQPQPLFSPDTPLVETPDSQAGGGESPPPHSVTDSTATLEEKSYGGESQSVTDQPLRTGGTEVPLDDEIFFEGVDSLAEEIDLEKPALNEEENGRSEAEGREEGLTEEVRLLKEENRRIRGVLEVIFSGMQHQIEILKKMITSAGIPNHEKSEEKGAEDQ